MPGRGVQGERLVVVEKRRSVSLIGEFKEIKGGGTGKPGKVAGNWKGQNEKRSSRPNEHNPSPKGRKEVCPEFWGKNREGGG